MKPRNLPFGVVMQRARVGAPDSGDSQENEMKQLAQALIALAMATAIAPSAFATPMNGTIAGTGGDDAWSETDTTHNETTELKTLGFGVAADSMAPVTESAPEPPGLLLLGTGLLAFAALLHGKMAK